MSIHTTITPTSMTDAQAKEFGVLNREENLHFNPYTPVPKNNHHFYSQTQRYTRYRR